MNVKDSQNMAGTLETLGFFETKKIEEAKIVIVNTCSVRQASEDKVYGIGAKYKGYKIEKDREVKGEDIRDNYTWSEDKPLTFITGCMVGSAKGNRSRFNLQMLKDRIPWADYFLAPEEETQLPEILFKEGLIDDWSFKAFGQKELEMKAKREEKSKQAFVNISYGCDNFCTFCVVPYARGKEISRPKDEIITEVKHALLRGYTEIMLLGQNVNSWGLTPTQKTLTRKQIGEHPFANLLKEVHDLEGITKVKFITANPWDFTPHLIETLKLPKIDRFLHLAVQSGSNNMLKEMNRRHTIEEFYELIKDIKETVPDMTFGTDIIVGFPGETDQDFEDTIKLLETVKFNVVYISKYSPRKGTPAAEYKEDNVPKEIKDKRHAKLLKIYNSNKSS